MASSWESKEGYNHNQVYTSSQAEIMCATSKWSSGGVVLFSTAFVFFFPRFTIPICKDLEKILWGRAVKSREKPGQRSVTVSSLLYDMSKLLLSDDVAQMPGCGKQIQMLPR
jgi:hypothetical protein